MAKEFRRDDDGCLNLQKRVTDVDKVSNQLEDDQIDNNSEINENSYEYDCYTVDVPVEGLEDCDDSDEDDYDGEVSISQQFSDALTSIYEFKFPTSAMLSSLAQLETSKKRINRLNKIKGVVDSLESTQFDTSSETLGIIIETFKQLINFCRLYKFYLDDVVNLKELLKDSDKVERLEIQKRRKKAKKMLNSFLIDMRDTISTLAFDTNLLSSNQLKYDGKSS